MRPMLFAQLDAELRAERLEARRKAQAERYGSEWCPTVKCPVSPIHGPPSLRGQPFISVGAGFNGRPLADLSREVEAIHQRVRAA